MQFHLNGFKPGDPAIFEPAEGHGQVPRFPERATS